MVCIVYVYKSVQAEVRTRLNAHCVSSKTCPCVYIKVIRKFVKKLYKSFRWHLGDCEKHNFFPFEGL